MKIVDPVTNMVRPIKAILFVEKVLDMKKKKNHWEVIAEIVKYWRETNPTDYKSFLIEADEKRQTRSNKYGSSKSGSMRSIIDIPTQVMAMMRIVYKPDELQMDKKFFREFGKRFPVFLVVERI